MVALTDNLMKKYHINIRHILNNSDNDFEDIKIESYIVVQENFEKLKDNDKCFIPLLKKRCLKNNKYGKRIECKDRWEEFNLLEENMAKEVPVYSDIDEDKICSIEAIKEIVSKDEYSFLMYFYTNGCHMTSKEYHKSEDTIYNKVNKLIEKIKKGGVN